MQNTIRRLTDSISTRVARLHRSAGRHRAARFLGARGSAALFLSTALSIGGISEMLDHVRFLVVKDLGTVRVVRLRGGDEKVVASMDDNFAGETFFKLARVLPDRYVSRELTLFHGSATDHWLATGTAHDGKGDVFGREMIRVNRAIRAEFFARTMPYGRLIHEKSQKYGVDPALVAAVIEQESSFKPRARSQVGARGLMQLMPGTGRDMGARNLYDPDQNVDAGVRYIKYLNARFHGDLKKTLAAYNAGEGNVERYRGIPPFGETRRYVRQVLRNYDKRTRQLEKYRKTELGGSIPEDDGTLALR
jgi:hypothetical protein